MIVADSGVPETKNYLLPFMQRTQIGDNHCFMYQIWRKNGNLVGKVWRKFSTSWAPVEACQISDHFSTCPNQLCQGKIQKKLLGPEQ